MGRVPTPADTGREGAGLQEESAGAAWSRSLRSRAAPPALDVLCAACHSGRTDVSFASGGTRTLRESPRPQTPGGRGGGCRQRALGLHGRALSARERLRLLSTYFAPHLTRDAPKQEPWVAGVSHKGRQREQIGLTRPAHVPVLS